MSGSHLSFHTVSSIVFSADQVLTVVFGMGTGVTPDRIATRHVLAPYTMATKLNLTSFDFAKCPGGGSH